MIVRPLEYFPSLASAQPPRLNENALLQKNNKHLRCINYSFQLSLLLIASTTTICYRSGSGLASLTTPFPILHTLTVLEGIPSG